MVLYQINVDDKRVKGFVVVGLCRRVVMKSYVISRESEDRVMMFNNCEGMKCYSGSTMMWSLYYKSI